MPIFRQQNICNTSNYIWNIAIKCFTFRIKYDINRYLIPILIITFIIFSSSGSPKTLPTFTTPFRAVTNSLNVSDVLCLGFYT